MHFYIKFHVHLEEFIAFNKGSWGNEPSDRALRVITEADLSFHLITLSTSSLNPGELLEPHTLRKARSIYRGKIAQSNKTKTVCEISKVGPGALKNEVSECLIWIAWTLSILLQALNNWYGMA